MHSKPQSQSLTFRTGSRATTAALGLAIVFLLTVVLTQLGQAQTFTVLYTFTGGLDGAHPYAGVTLDKVGNLYGTASDGGKYHYGAVYKLTYKNSSWVLSPLYDFTGGSDGGYPYGGITIGPNGSLYGTTNAGGIGNNGTVFNLKPTPTRPPTPLTPWIETVLYSFKGGSDGKWPYYVDLVFDQASAIYGTASAGGVGRCQNFGCGVVFKLTPSGQSYTQSVLYSFTDGSDGGVPYGGVIFDPAGNLYTTSSFQAGTVIQMSPSGGRWIETTIHAFQYSDGQEPWAGLTIDNSGNLYGTTVGGGPNGGGTVFELMPSGGGWTFDLLYGFSGQLGPIGGSVIMDAAGNLYGTRNNEGAYGSCGSVFKLTPSDGGWTYTSLHDFTCGSDGALPYGELVMDANGNIYGTASTGGTGVGVVWEITP